MGERECKPDGSSRHEPVTLRVTLVPSRVDEIKGILLAQGVSLWKVTQLSKPHKHQGGPFTLGRSDEIWSAELNCLLVPCNRDGMAGGPGQKHICIFFRDGQYLLVANAEERRTPDILMMACYVEDYVNSTDRIFP